MLQKFQMMICEAIFSIKRSVGNIERKTYHKRERSARPRANIRRGGYTHRGREKVLGSRVLPLAEEDFKVAEYLV